MSTVFGVNTKLEAYKLVYDPTRLLSLLFSKYGDIDEDFYLLNANQLVYNKSTHYNIYYKEFVLNINNNEFLRRFYKKKESTKRIPKLYEYYKNYYNFFCRPVFRNFSIAELMSNYEDTKAEIFYKNNYADDEDEKKNKDKKKIKNDSSSLSSLDNITDNKIIFNEKNKLIIDKDLDSKNFTLTLTNENNMNENHNASIIRGTGLLNTKRNNENNDADSFIKIVDNFINYKKKNEKPIVQNNNIKNNDSRHSKKNNNNAMNNKPKINCKVNSIKNNLYFLSKKKYINAQKINSNNKISYNINNNEISQKKINNIFSSPQTSKNFYTNISSRISEFNKNKPLNIQNGKKKNKSYNITNNKNNNKNSNNNIHQTNLITNNNTNNNSINNNNTLYNNFNNFKNFKNISATIKSNIINHCNNFNNSISKNITRNLTNIYNNRSNHSHQELKSNSQEQNKINQLFFNNNNINNNISDNYSNKNLKLPKNCGNAILNNLKKMTQSPSVHSPFGFTYKGLGSKFSLIKGKINKNNKNINNGINNISNTNKKNKNKNGYANFYNVNNNKYNNFLMYNQVDMGGTTKNKKKNGTQKNIIVSNLCENNYSKLNSICSPKAENNIICNNYQNYIDGVNKSKIPFIKAKNHISYSNNNFNINFNNIIFYGGQITPNNNICCINSGNKSNKNLDMVNCSPIDNISRNKQKISVKGFSSQSKGSKKNESGDINNKKIPNKVEKQLIEKNKNYTSNKIKKNTSKIKIDNVEFHANSGKNVAENNSNNIKNCKSFLMDNYMKQNRKKISYSNNYIRRVYDRTGNNNNSLKKIDKNKK